MTPATFGISCTTIAPNIFHAILLYFIFFPIRHPFFSHVANYLPLDEDLDYPARLEQSAETNSEASSSSRSPDVSRTWYPPLEKTITCLSKLYRCLEPAVFTGLAQIAPFDIEFSVTHKELDFSHLLIRPVEEHIGDIRHLGPNKTLLQSQKYYSAKILLLQNFQNTRKKLAEQRPRVKGQFVQQVVAEEKSSDPNS